MPLGFHFSLILVGFWKQVGKENRTKIDQKSIQKGIQIMMEKSGHLGRFGAVSKVGLGGGALAGGEIPAPKGR